MTMSRRGIQNVISSSARYCTAEYFTIDFAFMVYTDIIVRLMPLVAIADDNRKKGFTPFPSPTRSNPRICIRRPASVIYFVFLSFLWCLAVNEILQDNYEFSGEQNFSSK